MSEGASSSSNYARFIKEELIDPEYERQEASPPPMNTYEQIMRNLMQEIAVEDQWIASTPAHQQEWIRAQIEKNQKEVMTNNPAMQHKMAKATTKYKQMELEIRRKAIRQFEQHYYQTEQRVNPERSAKAKVTAGTYAEYEDDDDDIRAIAMIRHGTSKQTRKKRGGRRANGKKH
ncbi:unnamed protein product [Caenorhabditis sp. 36 PRJEB53466]|nr:unnamed protein product [Caenorhabditis sp. 36 PRJEB53466]